MGGRVDRTPAVLIICDTRDSALFPWAFCWFVTAPIFSVGCVSVVSEGMGLSRSGRNYFVIRYLWHVMIMSWRYHLLTILFGCYSVFRCSLVCKRLLTRVMRTMRWRHLFWSLCSSAHRFFALLSSARGCCCVLIPTQYNIYWSFYKLFLLLKWKCMFSSFQIL